MRIALLTGEFPPQPGGIGDYTWRLGLALVERGHQAFALTIRQGRMLCYDLCALEQVPACIADVRGWGWAAWRAVCAALAIVRPDVLHIQYQTGAYGMHPAINLLPWRLRFLQQRPCIAVTAHDLLPPYLFPKAGPMRGWATAALLAGADAAVLTNRADLAAARWLRRPATCIPIGSNIAVAPPPGYERAAARGRLGVAAGQPLIAFFGMISRTKGLDTLIDALARLPQAAHLLVIGGPAPAQVDQEYAAGIQRQIAAAGLAQRITITGHCQPHDVSAYLLAADVVALPFSDGASFRRGSLLAALAHGLPVVTTWPAPGAAPELADGENALLVPPGAPVALAQVIERVLHDAALRARLGQRGSVLAQQFGWETIARQHEVLYQRMIAA